jgi:hypothetical protein
VLELFISWSGEKSRAVALALGDWLPAVIHNVQPFVSANDIHAGTRWQVEIAARLETSKFGIVCVTKENQSNTWLNFEAGALAKAVDSSRVVPLAIDLKPSDVQIPLGQFQAQPATRDGIARILASINAACDPRLTESLLARATATWWPELDAALRRIENDSGDASKPAAPTRTDRELLEEMLDAVRDLAAQEMFPRVTDRLVYPQPPAVQLPPITIDISAFVTRSKLHRVDVDDRTTVADVLNSTYFALQNTVAAYTYGSEWILLDTAGEYLDRLRSSWAVGAEPNIKVDDRLLSEVGLTPGSRLLAARLTQHRHGDVNAQRPSSNQRSRNS